MPRIYIVPTFDAFLLFDNLAPLRLHSLDPLRIHLVLLAASRKMPDRLGGEQQSVECVRHFVIGGTRCYYWLAL